MFLSSKFPIPTFLATLLPAQFPVLIFVSDSFSVANHPNTIIVSMPLSSFSNGTSFPNTTRIPPIPLTI
jgi:hypothetical protein